MSIIVKSKQKKETAEQRINRALRKSAQFIHSLISEITWGQKYSDIGVRHKNTIKDICRAYSEEYHLRYLKKITQRDIIEHQKDQCTKYFSGSWRSKQRFTLVMFDVDILKVLGLGTPQGALDTARRLKDHFGQCLYFEPSTNGGGQHGYLILDKLGCHPEYVNKMLNRLETFCGHLCKGCDIEKVEIKGHCPVFEWSQGKKAVVENVVSMGKLAKLPRGDIRGALTLTVDDLARLQIPDCHNEYSSRAGSCFPIKEEDLSRFGEFQEMAEEVFIAGQWDTSNGKLVTAHDVQVFLFLLHWFTLNQKDGSKALPWTSWRTLWTALFEQGNVTRAFNPNRLKALRDGCSRLGIIQWHDNRYFFYPDGSQKGKCCEYEGSAEFMEAVECGPAKHTENNNNIYSKPPYINPPSSWQKPQLVFPPNVKNWHLREDIDRKLYDSICEAA